MQDEVDDEVIVANAALGISGDNYDEFDREIDPARLGDRLVQMNRQKGVLREFQLYDQTHLLVRDGDLDGSDARRYRVNLALVSAEPDHHKLVDWRWLYAALFFVALAAVFIYLGIARHLAPDTCMIGGTISLTLAALTGLIFAYRLHDEFTFRGHYGGAALFVMENKRPTQQVFDSFLVMLQRDIDRSQKDLPVADRLVGELKMCRRLRDEGIIDDEAYTGTRTLIFGHEQYKA